MKRLIPALLSIVLSISMLTITANAQQLPYDIGSCRDTLYEDDLYQGHYAGVKLSDDAAAEYPQLAESLNNWNDAIINSAVESGNEIIEAARADAGENEHFYGPYSLDESVSVVRADSRFFSVLVSGYAYSGGAHGMPFKTAACFDSSTGKQVEFHELIADMDGFTELVIKELNRLYPYLSMAEHAGEILADTELPPTFVVDNTGLTVYFGAYSLGSYAEGEQTVTVPYAGNENVFAMDISATEDIWCSALIPNTAYNIDLDGDGVTEQMYIYFAEDEYGDINMITFNINGIIYNNAIYALSAKPVLFHCQDGSNLLYLNTVAESDWQEMICFRLNSDGIEYLGEESVGFHSIWDGTMSYMSVPANDEFRLCTRCTILGTRGIEAEFKIGPEGLPVKTDELWSISVEMPQKVLKEFEAAAEDGSSVFVPAGSTVTYTATDKENIAVLTLEDGSNVSVFVDKSQWPYSINGEDISNIFDNIVYAG